MKARPVVIVAHGSFRNGYEVITCENGFQGTVVASGLHKREAYRIARAHLPSMQRKLIRDFDAQTKTAVKAMNGRPVEHLVEYEAYRAELRLGLLDRLRIAEEEGF